MAKYKVPIEELTKQLERQIGFIKRSCEAFDSGYDDEAARLAVAIRVLIHDTDRSTSLLQLLQKKAHIRFWDSTHEYDPGNFISHTGLVYNYMKVENGQMTLTYQPSFDGPNPTRGTWQGFQWWWHRQPVVVIPRKHTFTRKDLVLSVANKDGGAHVDHQLDAAYAELTRMNAAGLSKIKNGLESPPDNEISLPSIRQIAHEMTITLQHYFPEYFSSN